MACVAKEDLNVIKSLSHPPQLVLDILAAVTLLLGHTYRDDQNCRNKTNRLLRNTAELLQKIRDFDGSKVPQENIQKAKSLLEDMEPNRVKNACFAAWSLCTWAQDAVSGRA